MMCGLQGAGKTTHTAKLAKMYLKQGHRPLVAALDIYRPAAIEQLEVVAKQAGVPVFQMGKTDPVIVAKNAYNHAKDYGNDILILDTARPSAYRRRAYGGAYKHQTGHSRKRNPFGYRRNGRSGFGKCCKAV